MLVKVILVLVGSILFPMAGYLMDWKAHAKGRRSQNPKRNKEISKDSLVDQV